MELLRCVGFGVSFLVNKHCRVFGFSNRFSHSFVGAVAVLSTCNTSEVLLFNSIMAQETLGDSTHQPCLKRGCVLVRFSFQS